VSGEAAHERRGYLTHGLRVRSEVLLDAPTADGPFDLEVSLGERRPVPNALAPGELLSHLELGVGSSSLGRHDDGYTLRVHNMCDFEIDRELCTVSVHAARDEPDELAQLLLGGALALVLVLRGSCVLHASAVESEGRVVAFVAGSGMGKSTVAALCCIAGARMVSDDVLRVECDQAGCWGFSGSTELRLRKGASDLAQSLDGAPRRSTLDERTAVSPPGGETGRLPIGAIVAPVCDHDGDRLVVDRLRGSDALLELARFPRTIGWIDQSPLRRDFDVLAELAERVPIFRARLPWGPPFDPALGQRLLDAVGDRVRG
jgi:hypothetical protein